MSALFVLVDTVTPLGHLAPPAVSPALNTTANNAANMTVSGTMAVSISNTPALYGAPLMPCGCMTGGSPIGKGRGSAALLPTASPSPLPGARFTTLQPPALFTEHWATSQLSSLRPKDSYKKP